jgi:glycosyltransferase involved in cell wall biosynthesis
MQQNPSDCRCILKQKTHSSFIPGMPRIAIIGPAYPYRGGPPLVVAHLYEALSRSHSVEVFSFTRLYPSLLFPGTRQEDVSTFPAKVHPVRRIIDSMNPATWIRTAKAIIEWKPDLVLVDWYQPFFGLCYAVIGRMLKRQGIKIVYLAENVVSHEARWIDTMLTRRALNTSDGFVSFSASVESTLNTWYPQQRTERATLPLFFTEETSPVAWTKDAARTHLGITNARVLLFFGYIRKYKGLRNLIAAFPAIHKEFPDTFLLIVGECYENADEYKALIQKSGAADAIRWVNSYVPNEDIAMYYNAADIVVLPYDSATQSGIVKIAFGFEKPVLATRVGGLAEEIQPWNAGCVVEPHSTDALVEGMKKMLGSSLDPYVSGARSAKEANAFDAIVPKIESFLP